MMSGAGKQRKEFVALTDIVSYSVSVVALGSVTSHVYKKEKKRKEKKKKKKKKKKKRH